MRKFTEQQILEAVRDSRGIVAEVARKLKCGWICARNHMDKYPSVLEAEKSERESLCDDCENVMRSLLYSEEDKVKYNAAAFYLERLGKHRGFNTKQEIEMTGAVPVVIDDIPGEDDALDCSDGSDGLNEVHATAGG